MNEYAAEEDLLFDDYGRGVISTSQEIGDDYWEDVKEAQENFSFRLNGLTSVASIPESVVNTWLREGFDFWNANSQEILNKLRKDEYSRFILSGDKTF